MPSNEAQPAENHERRTGLPLLHSWRAVYLFVTAVFIGYATILTLLTRLYK